MANQGTFIVIEGSDGSGKGTQFRLLKERLRAVGYEVAEFDFPRYEQTSSHFVRAYLNGKYGPAETISPYTASLFYALDRYEAAADIKAALKSGKIVLANRYVGSNMAHQGAKIADPIEQRSFFVWDDSLEFQLLDLPRPNANIYLRVPAEVSFELIKQKGNRSYTTKSHDEHEANIGHLQRAVDTYDLLCKLFPRDFLAIDCTKDGQMLNIADINNSIWETISTYLPPRPSGRGRSVTLKLDGVDKKSKTTRDHPRAGAEKNTRRYHPGKIFLSQLLELEGLLPKNVHYRLSWDRNGYDYASFPGLPKNLQKKYEKSMESLGDLHKIMRDKLGKVANKDSLLAPAMPLGALIEAEFEFKPIDIQNLVRHLKSKPASQSKELLEKFLNEGIGESAAKKAKSAPSGILKIAQDFLPPLVDANTDSVTLDETLPRNEFKLLIDSLYSFSNLSRDQLEKEVEGWSYQKKASALTKVLNSDTAELDGIVQYRFDMLADHLTLSKLAGQGLSQSLHVQSPSPRYGYEVPKRVEELAIDDEYIQCFDISLELFSSLQAASEQQAAFLAVLTGHKVRFQLECSLSQLRILLASNNRDIKALATQMLNKVKEVHPLVGAFLIEQLNASLTRPQTHKDRPRRARRS